MSEVLDRLSAEEYFSSAVFTDLSPESLQLDGKEFYQCTFRNCKLAMSQWQSCIFETCTFEGCDLTRAQLVRAQLRGVRFSACKLMGIDFSHIGKNPELFFEECNLRYASFVGLNLRRTPFERCDLQDANFIDVDLSEALFADAELQGATLRGCLLADADFRSATGAFFDPVQNRSKGARISVETAIALALASGLLVAGTDADLQREAKKKKKR